MRCAESKFYSSLEGKLELKQFQFSAGTLTVEVSAPSKLRIVSAKGVVYQQSGNALSWTLPEGKTCSAQHIYLRVEADEIEGEDRLFTQAIQLI